MAAQAFFRTDYVVSPPNAVPLGTFPTGLNNILVTACNFLGQCGIGSQQLTVLTRNAPVVSIRGDSSSSITTSQAVQFSGDAFVSSCDGTTSRADLTYTWAVFVDGSQDFLLPKVDTSRQFDTFALPSNSLAVGSLYTFMLTVLDSRSSLSSVDSVSLNVIPGDIMAVIEGGATTAVQFGGVLTLDASDSLDQDKPGLTGLAAGLS
eukprot:CAMPEP_0119038606 /NCGR_PEP_ID=MMETSP1177-20130426/7626_1 /TAXON_ID=2985 /ORGANISM="Ochromonas sp, Strain CCMP1899" /LENGTH=205 /DNA_ID=CAMNT_0007001413 /DNA_START=82 /DNA_END=695 /DNA_ORIENTATION=+